ncbi:MaoC family dehydratase N-terminal domain-containing protein [Terricaulis sp.]|uniref:MaoC family dehydratase N-terminal domain-containing protein n=1 Tax=Terricaulis sp. TaxID=2768686 RepID=UPI003783A5E9
MIDRRFIGVVSEPRRIDVEKGQLKFFAKATGETNPIYFDEDAARRAGHPALPAPLTFMFCLASAAPAKRGDVFADMGVDEGRILHGEQSFTHHAAIYAGDVITLVTETKDIYSKKGGALDFIVQDTTATNQDGRLCAEMRFIAVVRNEQPA